MSFSPDEEAEALRAVVRDFLDKQSPEDEVRRLMETGSGVDPTVWRKAAEELGLHGIAIPERHGGSGAGPVELGVVFEEMGAALYCGPFFATVGLAATALTEFGGDGAAEYLPGIAAGDTIATLAWPGTGTGGGALRALETDGGWTVSGTAGIVIDGAAADLVLAAADTAAGVGLFAVDGTASGLRRTPLTTLDSTRKLAELKFHRVPARLLGRAEGVLRRTGDLATLYLAAEQLGGAARVLSTSVDYAGTRVQFGRAIGSFQAIKHRCADMLIDVESARSVVYHGLWTAVHDPVNLPAAAALARAIASDAYQRVAAHNVQIHGGIGFTWEHSAHLYLKRAKSSQLLLGPPARHRARLAELVDIAGTGAAGTRAAALEPALEPTPLEEAVSEFLRTHPVPDPADRAADRAFREARFDSGLAVVNFAAGFGGRGLDPSLQPAVEERFARAGAADHSGRNVIGLGMAMPTIHAHGTDEQKRRHLRPCFSGEHIWCQLFSEPGAGSDLAALATRAVRDGDDFVVNGQKIWTSLGHVSDWGILLARTDPDVPKHQGLTYFLLDMRSPGVEVRPLRQLTGEAEFNEVYLTDVRIPVANVLGEVGQGWRVAMTTLANERVSLGGRTAERGAGPIAQAVEIYRTALAEGRVDAATTERLMLLWTRAEAARLTNARAAAQIGREPGPEGSIAKLQMAELNKAIYELCVDLSGDAGLLIDDYTETTPDTTAVHGGSDVRKAYLRSLANSIEGGTSEVLRTILGERVLGLPGEPRIDRDIPWKDTRRS
ncbi:acyl-CoA dehydrogenase [Streptosporangium sp. NBC_01755]|uniref:acyl-CoA dehydrogenase n=1 Tax=unclassified Streptosporangium TaxID=2632669 RepID=UPI002DDAFDB1|nr:MULTISPECIES: acyl-CoA dehydrogenase [unclassified Streptosporangium]WSA24613.1 acyl-CoA dehydrogenase [Streptosporangium sp. NBC_01810]WSC97311.1 acyl-CoA dehydrogenase [Streptosporangium sp. NBC_01755]